MSKGETNWIPLIAWIILILSVLATFYLVKNADYIKGFITFILAVISATFLYKSKNS